MGASLVVCTPPNFEGISLERIIRPRVCDIYVLYENTRGLKECKFTGDPSVRWSQHLFISGGVEPEHLASEETRRPGQLYVPDRKRY